MGTSTVVVSLALFAFAEARSPRTTLEVRRAVVSAVPESLRAQKQLGDALAAQGAWSEALGQYQAVLAIDSNYPKANANAGLALLELGRPDEAIEHFERALALRRDLSEVHGSLGGLLKQRGDLARAAEHLEVALAGDPTPGRHADLGDAFALLGRTEEAIVQFRAALELDPEFAPAHGNLAIALQRSGDLDQAWGTTARRSNSFRPTRRVTSTSARPYRRRGTRTARALVSVGRCSSSRTSSPLGGRSSC